MYERFTANATQDLLHAKDEAKINLDNSVSTAHLLLGLIKNKNSMIGWVLRKNFLTLEKVRTELEIKIGKGFKVNFGEIPIGRESERILRKANQHAKSMGFGIFDSEDILHGILSDENCDGYQILKALKIDINILFDEINKIKQKKYPQSNKTYQNDEGFSSKGYDYFFRDSDFFNSEKKYNSEQFEDIDDDKNFSTSKDEDLISQLEIIGIINKIQLEQNDIFYWWQKKYLEIQKNQNEDKNESLIKLNSIRENLEKIDKKLLIKILKNRKTSNTFKNPINKNINKNNKSTNEEKPKQSTKYYKKGNTSKTYKNNENKKQYSKNKKQYPPDDFYWIINKEGLAVDEYSVIESLILNDQIIIKNSKGETIVSYWRDSLTGEWNKTIKQNYDNSRSNDQDDYGLLLFIIALVFFTFLICSFIAHILSI